MRLDRNHYVLKGDSNKLEFPALFDLILTSPPFFHPVKHDPKHGCTPPTRDLDSYAAYVAHALTRAATALRGGKLICVVKTDVWFRGKHIPIAYAILNACSNNRLQLMAHWIWSRRPYFSPYSPSFSNVLLFTAGSAKRPSHHDLISGDGGKTSHFPTSGIFAGLMARLSRPADRILDPFVGTGAVVEAAAATGRYAVGIDISAKQLRLAKTRLGHIPNVVFANLEDYGSARSKEDKCPQKKP